MKGPHSIIRTSCDSILRMDENIAGNASKLTSTRDCFKNCSSDVPHLLFMVHVMKDKKVREEREGEIVSPERILKLSLDFFCGAMQF